MDDFQKELEQAPWSILDKYGDLNDAWATWKAIYVEVLDKPMKDKDKDTLYFTSVV